MDIDKPEKEQYHLGAGQHLNVKAQYIVTIKEELKLFTGDGNVCNLEVDISADFQNIPPEYHHTFISMMTARYGGIVNCQNTKDTEPFMYPPTDQKKWWQIWKMIKI